MSQAEAQTLVLSFPDLPNLDAVGGNARHAHWAPAHRAFQAEKDKWIMRIREQLIPPMPHFEKASAIFTLFFKEYRTRDQDNLSKALKPLIDALLHWNIIAADDLKHFTFTIQAIVLPAYAPRTGVVLIETEVQP